MKNFIKILSFVLIIAMLIVPFASCGDKDDVNEDTTKSTDTNDTTPTDSDRTGKLIMGTNASFPPYEFYENNKIVGIDPEIAAAIAEKLNLELVIEDMSFDSIITSVTTGAIDIGMAGMTVTEDRLESVNFSTSYAKGVQVVIVKEDSDITSIDDLEGKKIGVQLSTIGDIYASDDFGKENVVQFATGNDAVIALTQGKVDAVIIDNEPAKAYVQANQGLKILETEYVEEDYAIAVAKDNTELLAKINTALEELIDDGVIDEIVSKYIKAD